MFFEKVLNELERLNLSNMDRILRKLNLDPVTIDLPQIPSHRMTLDETFAAVGTIRTTLLEALDTIHPYSYPYRTSTSLDITAIPLQKRYVFKDMRYNLGGAASSVIWDTKDIFESLQFLSARVLFIISRAGQGKTNFVCNFAETVLASRSIPCIFFRT